MVQRKYDPTKMFHLDVKVTMTFAGDDARLARRYIYDSLRKYDSLFAGFDGPKDPITMTFFANSGSFVKEVVDLLLAKSSFEDLEITANYFCPKDIDHKGSYKFGRRKKFVDRVLSSAKDALSGQTKLFV